VCPGEEKRRATSTGGYHVPGESWGSGESSQPILTNRGDWVAKTVLVLYPQRETLWDLSKQGARTPEGGGGGDFFEGEGGKHYRPWRKKKEFACASLIRVSTRNLLAKPYYLKGKDGMRTTTTC